ncbi:MAG: hypothetical protein G01um101472_236 [Parcubacteria group bacterium Gr01-1014_72]|nr:MAG: hypothetical protein G01um101472_236 [Parcubacteria group bacterium Gr01-1014_72]
MHTDERNRIATLLLTLILIGGSFFAGTVVGRSDMRAEAPLPANAESGKPESVDFSPFWRAWSVLNEKYVAAGTTTPDTERVWGAIQGLAESLKDPYTVFFPPEEAKIFESDISGSFEGVGMEIAIKDGLLTVVAPLKGMPAERAGILAGDRILKINDTPASAMKVEEAVKLIRGPRGTSVRISVIREGAKASREISIVRDVIQIPTIETELRTGTTTASLTIGGQTVPLRTDDIFILRLFSFSATAPQQFREALREFIQSGSHKLIIDLRNNPGGYLEAAVDLGSIFLPVGTLIVTEDFGKNQKPIEYRSRGYDIFNDTLRLVLLVNNGSASASEILAGALREHGKATLIGEKTFGKGSVQELVKITPETSLKVTVARWLTPKGVSISEGGLLPDIEVKLTPEDVEKKRDPQLERAIEFLGKQP